MTSLYIVAGFVAVFGFVIWLAMRAARKTGELEHRAETADASTRMARKAAKIDDEVSAADPARLRDELLKPKP